MRTVSTFMLAAGSAALLAACSEVKGSEAPVARPVKVAEARLPDIPSGIRYSVGIQPYDQVSLAFRAGGYVASVLQRRDSSGQLRAIQPGDQVTAGTVLATVRQSDYRERVNQAVASVGEVEASLEKARLDLERAQTLFDQQSLTRPELDAAQASYATATARLASSRAQVELARISLAETSLTAPVAGVVLERQIEVGSLVGSGTVGFVLGRVGEVKAVFGVPDSLVQTLVPGQLISITTEAYQGSTFPGRITGIAPSADPQSRVFDIEVTIANADGRLKPGMIGTVEVPATGVAAQAARIGVAVPLSAIVRSPSNPDAYSVFVVETDGDRTVARARLVELGPAAGNAVALTRGVEPGERVIVMGASLVTDGEPVRVIP
jgi:multidrug efflux system membrane fusion protein